MKWTRLFGLTAGRGRRPSGADDDDPAGMGTAFGLDATVQDAGDWRAEEPEPARAALNASGAAHAGSAPALSQTFHDRIVRRSRL